MILFIALFSNVSILDLRQDVCVIKGNDKNTYK